MATKPGMPSRSTRRSPLKRFSAGEKKRTSRVYRFSLVKFGNHATLQTARKETCPTMMMPGRLIRLLTWIQTFWLLVISAPALAQFSPEQETAFSGAIVGNRGTADLNLLIAAVILVLILFGFAWIAYAAFGRWADGRLGTIDVALLLGRVSVLIIVAGLFLR